MQALKPDPDPPSPALALRPPLGGGLPALPFDMYVAWTEPHEFDEDEAEAHDQAKKDTPRLPTRFRLGAVPSRNGRWTQSRDDVIVWFWGDADNASLTAPTRVLAVRDADGISTLVYQEDTTLDSFNRDDAAVGGVYDDLTTWGDQEGWSCSTPLPESLRDEVIDLWGLWTCPRCGGASRRIRYGLTGPTSDVIGGCVFGPDSPRYVCAECEHTWGCQ